MMKALIILANPISRFDDRSMVINELCASFCEGLSFADVEIDYIDLYRDDFNPVLQPDEKDTKTIEYQIRIRKADILIFFHPVWWGSMPAIMKGFCDKVLRSGFAYSYQRGKTIPLLDNKKSIVVTLSKEPAWKDRLVYGNLLEITWKRAIFETCGIKGRYINLNNLRKVDDKTIQNWNNDLRQLGESIKKS